MDPANYTAAIRAELTFPMPLETNSNGMPVKRVQEWLNFHRRGTAIDGDYGSATRKAVTDFQHDQGMPATGRVDQNTWDRLVAPMRGVLRDGQGANLPARVASIARSHLAAHPVELGGDNRGPWVRMYTGGFDGPEWLWCAGFVSFVLAQACAELERHLPIKGSVSCDTLAAQAKAAGLFVSEEDAAADSTKLGESYIFLIRRASSDWIHTGFGVSPLTDSFTTIEGNANDSGGRGHEVCQRYRSTAAKDFIRLP